MVCSKASKQDAIDLLKLPPEKVSVIYGSVEVGFGQEVPQERIDEVLERYGIRPPYFLFVGTLEPRKNVVGIVRAFSKIYRDLPHVLVLAGGAGWGEGAIDAAIDAANLDDRVIRTGYVPKRSDIEALYVAADAFVFPSLYEGFGLPILEAMACGCPVVTSNNSSLPEVGGAVAIYANPFDIDSIAEGMRDVVSSRERKYELADAGREQVKKFSWDRSAKELLQLYDKVAG